MHEPPNPQFLATAVEAVVRAGEIQMARRGHVQIDKKGAIDLVTDVDLAVERMFRALIGERFPDHDILAEEMGQTRNSGARYRWVFDPLDGTTNYAHGIPIFCSTVALEQDGEPIIGAVFDPNREELFTAERGVGAWMNGAPMRVSTTATLIDAVLVTGFPYDVKSRAADILGLFGGFLQEARAVRRLGSAAIDLCWVGAGRMDAFWEQGLQAWDTMAGALIVQEAGGRVTALDGGPWIAEGGQCLATNGVIHAAMLDIAARGRRP